MNKPLNRQLRERIDDICDRFEQQWQDGKRPRLESFAEELTGDGADELFAHLLGLEIEYRQQAGERLDVTDYSQRFPQRRREIEDVLSVTRAPSGPVASTVARRPAPPTPAAAPSTVVHDGQFVPGNLVARRYRIVALLGRGGMGEVYRADDLKLGQPVALKFVAAALSGNQQLLELFHNEVRLSRQITHPHVCRVFDIGEFEGQHYLTMEYIDGEPLSHLIRRIGPLPHEKCLDLARQMSLALAAAHESNVLHRDLKPGNVMIDGRGRAKITDFGLARLAHRSSEREPHVGTPAYMAPEQFLRNETSEQSDLFALGLVMYEMCTGVSVRRGRTASQLQAEMEAVPREPSELAPAVDHRLSDAIMWCLRTAPEERPSSSGALAGALPGGDSLTAAVAAGETPSPEMVAASSGNVVARRATLGVGVAALAAMVAAVALSGMFWDRLGLEKSPPMLVDAARQVLDGVGANIEPVDEAWGWAVDRAALRKLTQEGRDWSVGAAPAAAPIYFWYRRSDRPLMPHRPDWTGESFLAVSEFEPPLGRGEALLRLAPNGRLLSLDARPDSHEGGADVEEGQAALAPGGGSDEGGEPVDWGAVWQAAGWSDAWGAAAPVVPQQAPATFATAQAAWTGDWQQSAIRIEAAARRGRVVHWQTQTPWSGEHLRPRSVAAGKPLRTALMLLWIPALLAASVCLALRNRRRGRGDSVGATRLATFLFCLSMIVHLLRDSHVAGPLELDLLLSELAGSLLLAAVAWLAYMALEPQVRRTWPRTLVGWTRALSGQFRDPIVGRDLLWGAALGLIVANIKLLIALTPSWIGAPADAFPAFMNLSAALGGRLAVGEALSNVGLSILYSLFNQLLFLALLFAILKRQLAALAVYVLFLSVLVGGQFQPLWLGVTLTAVEMTLTAALFLRCGLLAVVAMHFVRLMFKWPITWDMQAWHADVGLLALVLAVGVAAYGFLQCWSAEGAGP